MKYVSIDIESSGLDHKNCQILSVGAVVEDTNNILPLDELPTFHCAVLHNRIEGEPFAVNLNKELISRIVEYQTSDDKEAVEKKYNMLFRKEEDVVKELWKFLIRSEVIEGNYGGHVEYDKKHDCWYPTVTSNVPVSHITVAGKNVATFDKLFLEQLPRWKQLLKIRQRIIDPTVFFTDWSNDEALPNLSTCKERAGFDSHVSHDAVDDAKDVIRLLRKNYE